MSATLKEASTKQESKRMINGTSDLFLVRMWNRCFV